MSNSDQLVGCEASSPFFVPRMDPSCTSHEIPSRDRLTGQKLELKIVPPVGYCRGIEQKSNGGNYRRLRSRQCTMSLSPFLPSGHGCDKSSSDTDTRTSCPLLTCFSSSPMQSTRYECCSRKTYHEPRFDGRERQHANCAGYRKQ